MGKVWLRTEASLINLPGLDIEEIRRSLINFRNNGARDRVISVNYDLDGGHDNGMLTIDLEAVTAITE